MLHSKFFLFLWIVIFYLKKDGDKSRKDYSEDIAIKIKVKVDTLEFQIKHYACEDENYHAKLTSKDELNSSLKWDEIKTNSWKRIMEMKFFLSWSWWDQS